MKPRVSILIVHMNGEEIIDNCLNSLAKTKYSNFEVILLLNATTDNSEQIAKKYNAKIYKSKENLGFSGGVNFLINKSKGDYIVFLNNDTEVEPSWLDELVSFAEKYNVAVCQPKILNLKNKECFEYAGASGYYMDKYCYPFTRGRIFDTTEKDFGQYDDPLPIFYSSGACMLIKREVLSKTGLLDEDFFAYFEETDLCWRINLLGEKIYCVPSSVIYHLGGFTIKKEKMNVRKEYLVHRNGLITFFKNYDKKTIKRLIIPRILLELISAVAYPKKFIPIMKSFKWLIKNRELIRSKHKDTQRIRKVDDRRVQEIMLKKSIVWLYFIKGKKTFDEIEEYF